MESLESLEDSEDLEQVLERVKSLEEKDQDLERVESLEEVGMMEAACIGGMAGNGIVGTATPQEEKLASLEEETVLI